MDLINIYTQLIFKIISKTISLNNLHVENPKVEFRVVQLRSKLNTKIGFKHHPQTFERVPGKIGGWDLVC